MLRPFANPFPHLSSWIEGGRSVVFCSHRETLVALDSAGTGAFLGYCSRLTPAAVTAELRQLGGFGREAAASAAARVSQLLDMEQALPGEPRRPDAAIHAWQADAAHVLMLRLGQATVRVLAPMEWRDDLAAVLGGAVVDGPMHADAECRIARDPADPSRWALGDAAHLEIGELRREEALPLLIDRLQRLAYRQPGARIALHGAAIHWRGRNWLLPGASGAGKSTLAMRLLHDGGRCYSDEIIALDAAYRPGALNLPVALKSGSWALFGGLEGRCQWRRRDGRRLGYLWPPRFAAAADAAAPAVLVFPAFRPGAALAVRRLGVIESLERLAAGGYEFLAAEPLGIVEGLVQWLNHLPRFALEYGEDTDLPAALSGLAP